ncbi:hypothetical protein PF004_g29612 [Phytophthora fragariae]|uniref:Pectate lyase n=1 Tax=Phytophthora fragariae TaxID=53985 RepID=A0A6G0ME94_9STRA|nr:hypothetical protein PF004_g29612 [Phytophthora fragariae]
MTGVLVISSVFFCVGGGGGTVIQPRSTVIQGRSTVNHTEGSLHNPYWLIVGNNSTRHRPKH